MMPFFRPRIGEKHPHLGKSDVIRQRVEEFTSFRMHEVAVREPAASGLFATPADALGVNIDAYAGFFGEFLSVSREEMPVTGPDFPYNRLFFG